MGASIYLFPKKSQATEYCKDVDYEATNLVGVQPNAGSSFLLSTKRETKTHQKWHKSSSSRGSVLKTNLGSSRFKAIHRAQKKDFPGVFLS
jgi:hypothetical protein